MNNKYWMSFFIVLLFVVLASCKKNEDITSDEFKILKEEEKILTTSNSVQINGCYSFSGHVSSIKLQLSTDEEMHGLDEFDVELQGKSYSVVVNDLQPNTLYYYRYSVNFGSDKKKITEIDNFLTQSAAPEVLILEALPIDSISVRVKCKIVSIGGTSIKECGICWDTHDNPTIDDRVETYPSPEELIPQSEYACRLTNLAESTVYYVCAYAKNESGISYSDDVISFQTGSTMTLPTVITVQVSDITGNSAIGEGLVVSAGGSEIIERGLCWGVNENPDLSSTHASNGNEIGNFFLEMTSLSLETQYYVRAYATNTIGTAYGNPLSFTTKDGKPVVLTDPVTDITGTSARCGGNVIDEGISEASIRGICWSSSPNPTPNDNHLSIGSGLGSFSATMNDLITGQTYYVRAYAINNLGIGYGEERNFIPRDGLPTVETLDVTNISSTSATGHGKIIDNGGFPINEYGICWSEQNEYPTIENDFHGISNSSMDYFSVIMEHLTAGKVYHIRAYATNTIGTNYGNPISFPTLSNLPEVTTLPVTQVTATSAWGGGIVTAMGGSPVTERGICWSLSPNPTIENDKLSSNSGLGEYQIRMAGLLPNTQYYVRAYAINSAGDAYGDNETFITLLAPPTPEGAINGLFSVSDTQKVWFSKGNLQYNSISDTWRFADNQYDYIGNDNSNISPNYEHWIDLFGWGTSGHAHGAISYEPWSTSTNNSEYWAYGNQYNHLNPNNGEVGQADWGYNAISNGGDQNQIWQTLKSREWEYVFQTRETVSGIRFAKACINDCNGVILLPDDWDSAYYPLNNADKPSANYTSNPIELSDWYESLESHGAVFLPASGYRTGTTMYYVNDRSFYWSSETAYNHLSYALDLRANNLVPISTTNRSNGAAVRLVHFY